MNTNCIQDDMIAQLADDLALVNDRLSHTLYRVVVSAENGAEPPAVCKISLTLESDFPDESRCIRVCYSVDVAVQALWQLCAIGLWMFSFEACPSTLGTPS